MFIHNSSPFHTTSNRSNCFKSNAKTPVAAGNFYSASSSTENSNGKSSENVSASSNMSPYDFIFLIEQMNQMFDAMSKTTTVTEAVQVAVKFTNKIVNGLRF